MREGGSFAVCTLKWIALCFALPCSFFRLEEIVLARLVAGFARAGKVRSLLAKVWSPCTTY